MDYPDAITEGLRRRINLAHRQNTRADITLSFRQMSWSKRSPGSIS